MTKGGDLFFRTLVEYLTYFAGRTAMPVTVFRPPVTEWPYAWAVLQAELGLSGPVRVGDRIDVTPDGLQEIRGVVYFVNPHALGVRSTDGLYRFIRGFFGSDDRGASPLLRHRGRRDRAGLAGMAHPAARADADVTTDQKGTRR